MAPSTVLACALLAGLLQRCGCADAKDDVNTLLQQPVRFEDGSWSKSARPAPGSSGPAGIQGGAATATTDEVQPAFEEALPIVKEASVNMLKKAAVQVEEQGPIKVPRPGAPPAKAAAPATAAAAPTPANASTKAAAPAQAPSVLGEPPAGSAALAAPVERPTPITEDGKAEATAAEGKATTPVQPHKGRWFSSEENAAKAKADREKAEQAAAKAKADREEAAKRPVINRRWPSAAEIAKHTKQNQEKGAPAAKAAEKASGVGARERSGLEDDEADEEGDMPQKASGRASDEEEDGEEPEPRAITTPVQSSASEANGGWTPWGNPLDKLEDEEADTPRRAGAAKQGSTSRASKASAVSEDLHRQSWKIKDEENEDDLPHQTRPGSRSSASDEKDEDEVPRKVSPGTRSRWPFKEQDEEEDFFESPRQATSPLRSSVSSASKAAQGAAGRVSQVTTPLRNTLSRVSQATTPVKGSMSKVSRVGSGSQPRSLDDTDDELEDEEDESPRRATTPMQKTGSRVFKDSSVIKSQPSTAHDKDEEEAEPAPPWGGASHISAKAESTGRSPLSRIHSSTQAGSSLHSPMSSSPTGYHTAGSSVHSSPMSSSSTGYHTAGSSVHSPMSSSSTGTHKAGTASHWPWSSSRSSAEAGSAAHSPMSSSSTPTRSSSVSAGPTVRNLKHDPNPFANNNDDEEDDEAPRSHSLTSTAARAVGKPATMVHNTLSGVAQKASDMVHQVLPGASSQQRHQQSRSRFGNGLEDELEADEAPEDSEVLTHRTSSYFPKASSSMHSPMRSSSTYGSHMAGSSAHSPLHVSSPYGATRASATVHSPLHTSSTYGSHMAGSSMHSPMSSSSTGSHSAGSSAHLPSHASSIFGSHATGSSAHSPSHASSIFGPHTAAHSTSAMEADHGHSWPWTPSQHTSHSPGAHASRRVSMFKPMHEDTSEPEPEQQRQEPEQDQDQEPEQDQDQDEDQDQEQEQEPEQAAEEGSFTA